MLRVVLDAPLRLTACRGRAVVGMSSRTFRKSTLTDYWGGQVVYFATCVSRSMGPARGDSEDASIHDKTMSVLAKAGYEVRPPRTRIRVVPRIPRIRVVRTTLRYCLR